MCAVVDDAAGADVLNDVRAVVTDGVGVVVHRLGCGSGAKRGGCGAMGCDGEEHAGLPQCNFQAQGLFEGSSNSLLSHSVSYFP